MEDDQQQRPDSLLPYERWIERALRHVVAQAIEHVAREGLPGGHHFYITFRTGDPGVELPARMRAQYPKEMTIVLQHQFWDLAYDREAQTRPGRTFIRWRAGETIDPARCDRRVCRSAYSLWPAFPTA